MLRQQPFASSTRPSLRLAPGGHALRMLDKPPPPAPLPARAPPDELSPRMRAAPRAVGGARESRGRGATPTKSLKTKRPRVRCPQPLAPVHSPAPERPPERPRVPHSVQTTQAPYTASGRGRAAPGDDAMRRADARLRRPSLGASPGAPVLKLP